MIDADVYKGYGLDLAVLAEKMSKYNSAYIDLFNAIVGNGGFDKDDELEPDEIMEDLEDQLTDIGVSYGTGSDISNCTLVLYINAPYNVTKSKRVMSTISKDEANDMLIESAKMVFEMMFEFQNEKVDVEKDMHLEPEIAKLAENRAWFVVY